MVRISLLCNKFTEDVKDARALVYLLPAALGASVEMKKILTRAQAARLRCQLNANSWRGESWMVRVQKSKAETALERLTTSRSDGCARDKRIFPPFVPEFHLSDTDVVFLDH
jgi:hypothetical protein